MKRVYMLALLVIVVIAVAGCSNRKADVVSNNLSKAADQFEVERRVVFYNGITDTYMLTIEGRCSLGNNDRVGELTVTCQTGPDLYKKHFLGLSDNVTFFVEHLESTPSNPYRYKVIFRPSTILPDIDLDLGGGETGQQ